MRLFTIIITTAVLLAAAPLPADELEVGALAPSFTLPDQDGELRALEDYRDQWVVLYFDPKGRIAKHYTDVDPETHSSQILDDLAVLQAE